MRTTGLAAVAVTAVLAVPLAAATPASAASAYTVTKTIRFGPIEPDGVAVAPDSATAYIASYETQGGPGSISMISASAKKITRSVLTGRSTVTVAVSPSGRTLYAVNYGEDSVSVISAATGTVTATIKVGKQPMGVAVSPSGST